MDEMFAEVTQGKQTNTTLKAAEKSSEDDEASAAEHECPKCGHRWTVK
jgi:hypothetical protein